MMSVSGGPLLTRAAASATRPARLLLQGHEWSKAPKRAERQRADVARRGAPTWDSQTCPERVAAVSAAEREHVDVGPALDGALVPPRRFAGAQTGPGAHFG